MLLPMEVRGPLVCQLEHAVTSLEVEVVDVIEEGDNIQCCLVTDGDGDWFHQDRITALTRVVSFMSTLTTLDLL